MDPAPGDGLLVDRRPRTNGKVEQKKRKPFVNTIGPTLAKRVGNFSTLAITHHNYLWYQISRM